MRSPKGSVAIVGMGGVFPGSPDPAAFWNHILSGRSLAREAPRDRWLLGVDSVYDPRPGTPDKVYSRRGCFIEEKPAVGFSSLAIDEALIDRLDPLFRLVLAAGQQAFRDANLETTDLSRVGVILGNIALPTEGSSALSREVLGRTFEEVLFDTARAQGLEPATKRQQGRETDPLNGHVTSFPAGMLARALRLGGGVLTLDAACASSLYAVKLACDELLSGRADAVLSGGVSRPDPLYTQMGFSQLRALSPTGLCSPFDRKANGLVVGEGCGIVVLKRTEDAVRDGDQIYGTIRAAGLSNDIGGSLLAPSSEGQLRAMRSAYEAAGWSPDQVDLIECHATGTPLGDGVEFSSLRSLWEGARPDARAVIGSVKSNIGHMLTGAGSAALIKVLLAMREKTLPPTANFETPNESVPLSGSPFEVLSEPEAWHSTEGRPRRAAVSAFGFGGINAHLLVEEWRREVEKVDDSPIELSSSREAVPVSIVGMDVHVGPWKNLRAFQERVLGGGTMHEPQFNPRWWGAEKSRWLEQLGIADRRGYFIHDVSLSLDQFRIPPREVEEMLPQQILMLDVMAKALRDASLTLAESSKRCGVFIGVGLDLNTTNFTFRWSIEREAECWARELGIELTDEERGAWVAKLREDAGPALSANRTMGALASIIASRIAREFRIGGPSITVSAEGSSGARALEIATRALQRGEIDYALVGSVDLAGDLRAVLGDIPNGENAATGFSERRLPAGRTAAFQAAPCPPWPRGERIPSDGAVALILCRAEDADRDGARTYATIRGIGTATGGHETAVTLALSEARTRIEGIALMGDQAGSDVSTLVGDCGAASSLMSVARNALALYQEILPAVRKSAASVDEDTEAAWKAAVRPAGSRRSESPRPARDDVPQFWLHDRAEGPRFALAQSESIDGNTTAVVLADHPQGRGQDRQPLGDRSEALFVIAENDPAGILRELGRLAVMAMHDPNEAIEPLARRWFRESGADVSLSHVMAIVARSPRELREQIDFAMHSLQSESPQSIEAFGKERLFYGSDSSRIAGGLAFVFPGSGSHFEGMGRELSVHWPEVFRNQQLSNDRLLSQYRADVFWDDPKQQVSAGDAIFGQVSFGTAMSDLLRSAGVTPDAAIGYSLGETAALLSLGVWRDRDEMLRRMESSSLFVDDLAGRCQAARTLWGLADEESVDWLSVVVNRPAVAVAAVLEAYPRAYLTLINTPDECVIGGDRAEIESVVRDLGAQMIPLDAVSTVHCPVVGVVEEAYRALHLLPVTVPDDIVFYSGAAGVPYEVTGVSAAESILKGATGTLDFARLIVRAYDDGIRIFAEIGPGSSCTRMISKILGERPHVARSASVNGVGEVSSVLRLLALLISRGIAVDLETLYGVSTEADAGESASGAHRIHVAVGGAPFTITSIPEPKAADPEIALEAFVPVGVVPLGVGRPARSGGASRDTSVSGDVSEFGLLSRGAARRGSASGGTPDPQRHDPHDAVLAQASVTDAAHVGAHEAFLRFSSAVTDSMTRAIEIQMEVVDRLSRDESFDAGPVFDSLAEVSAAVMVSSKAAVAPRFDRDLCMEIAIGSIARVLGPQFAEVDTFPTRVRLPDEPLMLVDRIMEIEGEPLSMTSGRVVTEHDVRPGAWYLDCGRMVTCIAVESGQADLFLSGYLGIDFITRGLAMYRLLDAVVTFHDELPKPGDVVRYDIRIDHFFKQGETYLFRFEFEGTVNGKPLLTMKKGCAGFFTPAELAAGRGVVQTALDLAHAPGVVPDDWRPLVPMRVESYDDSQIDALRRGDLAGCFGARFAQLDLRNPVTLPSHERLALVDRVIEIDPDGGRFGLGFIRAELDVYPDSWFLTCHFSDDQVMPGTLMFECCLHTLRIFLLRMGWIGEEGEVTYQPVEGIGSQLKCRGQVTEATRKVTYEVTVKEIGFGPEPYAIANSLMYADGKPIVEVTNMTVRLTGLTRERLEDLWAPQSTGAVNKPLVFTKEQVFEFTSGSPSKAFGEPYRPFDEVRVIARLPQAPYCFLDRVVECTAEPFVMKAGGTALAEYDVRTDAWYFDSHRSDQMPFAVLLEIALQPCGWLAAWVGSALTSPIDLCFRNLGGSAVQHRVVGSGTGTLSIRVRLTRVATTAGMTIQNYDFVVSDRVGVVYEGDTVFGFFTHEALRNQVGVRDAKPWAPSEAEIARGRAFEFPVVQPFPDRELRMVERIDLFVPDGGPYGLGFIRGSKPVDPEEWFFKAHFYQDPVCPGSLGLEAFVQLLEVVASERWGAPEQFGSVAVGTKHNWIYRGQIIPSNQRVVIEAMITSIDDATRTIRGAGFLSVDGKIIYQMNDFSIQV